MKTKKLLSLLLLGMLCSIGITWAGEITVTPPALTNITTTYYGLYTMTHSSTAESNGSKISSGAITTGTKGDVITINFATTKSDMYIKSITFNSLSNGTLGSNDGSYNTSTKVFTVSGNKTSVGDYSNMVNFVLPQNVDYDKLFNAIPPEIKDMWRKQTIQKDNG